MSAINLYDIQSAYQSIAVTDGGGSLTVDGTVAATQSGVWDIGTVTTLTSITNDVNIADGGNSITVDATNLDIRDLAFASDSVTAHQGGTWTVNSLEAGYSSWKVTVESVTTTESELMATPLANRLSLLIQNTGTADVYIKEATGVSTANGLKLPKGGYFEAALDAGANLFAITGSGTANLRCIEYAS